MANDLINLIRKYKGEWVALKPETGVVVSNGKVAKKVFVEAQKRGVKIPTLFKVPVDYTPYIG